MSQPIVNHEEWLVARKKFLIREKEFTRLRDELNAARRSLPKRIISKQYEFKGRNGTLSLADMFDEKSQLVIYHFMLGPDWAEGCPSCSFWADSYSGTEVHLAQRDIRLAAVSRAPLEKILAYKKRMGWTFDWFSSEDSDFNFDFAVSFTDQQHISGEPNYNYETVCFPMKEAPGFSVFQKAENGDILHTYSTFARGLDSFNSAYQIMDITPKGRNEEGLPHPMAWLKRHDQY